MATVEQALASTLRALREQRGISLTEVGESVGHSSAQISRWENALRTPSPSQLYSISKVYNTTPSAIYEMSITNDVIDKANLETIHKRNEYANRNKNKVKK